MLPIGLGTTHGQVFARGDKIIQKGKVRGTVRLGGPVLTSQVHLLVSGTVQLCRFGSDSCNIFRPELVTTKIIIEQSNELQTENDIQLKRTMTTI